jgi:hypothetical protein
MSQCSILKNGLSQEDDSIILVFRKEFGAIDIQTNKIQACVIHNGL